MADMQFQFDVKLRGRDELIRVTAGIAEIARLERHFDIGFANLFEGVDLAAAEQLQTTAVEDVDLSALGSALGNLRMEHMIFLAWAATARAVRTGEVTIEPPISVATFDDFLDWLEDYDEIPDGAADPNPSAG